MAQSTFRLPLLAAFLFVIAAPAFAAMAPLEAPLPLQNPGLSDRLEAHSNDVRGAALQEVIHLATNSPDQLDAPALMPILFSIVQNDESPQFRVMASQAIAAAGTRADAHKLSRLARRDPSPWARRQMQLAASAATNRWG